MKKPVQVTIILAIAAILISILTRQCQVIREKDEVITQKDGVIVKTKNKLGQITSSTKVLEVENNKLKKSIREINDSAYFKIRQLERYYKRRLIAASTFNIITRDTVSGKTIVSIDTIIKDSLCPSPIYSTTILKKYSKYKIVANKDSIQLIDSISNPIDLSFTYEKTKLKNFSSRKNLEVNVTTYNHSSDTEELRAFHHKERKRNIALKTILIVAGIEVIRSLIHP